jgi:hypothetical protein
MKRSGGAQPTAKRSISLSDQAMQALQIPSGNDAQPPPTMLTGAVRDGGEGRDSPVPSSSVPSSKGKGPPPVLASSLTATCIHYITDTETIEHTLPFIKFFREYVNGNQLSRSQQNSYTMLDFTFFHVLSELVQMQSRIVDLLRNKFAFPVDNLTTDGLNRDDPAWARFREANHADHLRLVQRLDGLILSTNEAFQELGCAIFDPVSTCFFLAIHALSVKLNSQSEHNAFLGIACQGIAVVSPPCRSSVSPTHSCYSPGLLAGHGALYQGQSPSSQVLEPVWRGHGRRGGSSGRHDPRAIHAGQDAAVSQRYPQRPECQASSQGQANSDAQVPTHGNPLPLLACRLSFAYPLHSYR